MNLLDFSPMSMITNRFQNPQNLFPMMALTNNFDNPENMSPFMWLMNKNKQNGSLLGNSGFDLSSIYRW